MGQESERRRRFHSQYQGRFVADVAEDREGARTSPEDTVDGAGTPSLSRGPGTGPRTPARGALASGAWLPYLLAMCTAPQSILLIRPPRSVFGHTDRLSPVIRRRS